MSIRCEEKPLVGGGALGVITLNKPEALNALDTVMVSALWDILQRWQHDAAIRAVFIDSVSDKAFCAGGDVRAMRESALQRAHECLPCEAAEAFFALEYRVDYALHTFSKPVIVWGHGIVMGGGMGIWAGGSHRVVTESTMMAMPEISIGLFPDVGAGYFLQKMPGRAGLFCALTAARLTAKDAMYAGLATHCIAHHQKNQVLAALCAAPLSGDGVADRRRVTHVLNDYVCVDESGGATSALQSNQRLIDQVCQAQTVADIVNNVLAIESEDPWWLTCQQALRQASPLSLRVIERQWRMTAQASLAEVFQLDYVLATQLVRHPEFSEGVRALLVDKDRQPQWTYTSIGDVPEADIDALFTPPWEMHPLADLGESQRVLE